MSKARVYLAAGTSRAVERRIPEGDFARVAFHGCGDGSRSLELYVDERGIWDLAHRPGPAHGGSVVSIARGCLPTDFEFTGGPPPEVSIHADQIKGRAVDLEEIRRGLAALERIITAARDGSSSGADLAQEVYAALSEAGVEGVDHDEMEA
jgi:hypothetical protein